jgi:hypothetical protein
MATERMFCPKKTILLEKEHDLNKKGQSKTDDLFSLSGKRDSNSRPSAWEADALPTELLPLDYFISVWEAAALPCLPAGRQLSYSRLSGWR